MYAINVPYSAKLRAVKLQSYWKKICDDEKRSRQRNAQLLRDLDRMEGNMANLEARREKLRHLKVHVYNVISTFSLSLYGPYCDRNCLWGL